MATLGPDGGSAAADRPGNASWRGARRRPGVPRVRGGSQPTNLIHADRGATYGLLARGGNRNVIGSVISGAASFGVTLLVTHLLPLNRAAAVLISISSVTLASRASLVGADIGIARFAPLVLLSGEPSRFRRLLLSAAVPVVALSITFAVALTIAANTFGRLFGGHGSPALVSGSLRAVAWSIPFAALLEFLMSSTRAFGTMEPTLMVDRTLRSVSQPVLMGGVAATYGATMTRLSFAWALPFALVIPLALASLARLVRASLVIATPASDAQSVDTSARAFWRFSSPRSAAGVFQLAIDRLDVFLLGAMVSLSTAGIYASSLRYLMAPRAVGSSLTQAAQPLLGRAFAHSDHRLASAIYKATTALQVMVSFPILLFMVFLSPLLMRLLGRAFITGAVPLSIVAAGLLVATAPGPVDVVLLMGGRSMWSLLNLFLTASVNIGLNLLLIPQYGMKGSAIAWAASLFVGNVIPAIEIWYLLHLHAFGATWVRLVVANLACFAIPLALLRVTVGPKLLPSLLIGGLGTAAYGLYLISRRELMTANVRLALGSSPPSAPDAPAVAT